MGWTRRNVGVTVLLAMDEHRKQAGQRLAQIRDAQGLSQEDLARKAELSVKTISRFENGRHDGRRDTVRRIVEALGIEEADLIGPPPDPLGLSEPSQLDRIELAVAENRAMLEEIRALRADVKKLALTVAQQSRELRVLRGQGRRKEPPPNEQQ
jgi:transcriptional regulator with XRE-family HTH domain